MLNIARWYIDPPSAAWGIWSMAMEELGMALWLSQCRLHSVTLSTHILDVTRVFLFTTPFPGGALPPVVPARRSNENLIKFSDKICELGGDYKQFMPPGCVCYCILYRNTCHSPKLGIGAFAVLCSIVFANNGAYSSGLGWVWSLVLGQWQMTGTVHGESMQVS